MTAPVLSFPRRRVSPSTTAIINTQAAVAAAWPLDETNPALDSAVREVGIALMAEIGHSLDPHEVHDCFVGLVDVTQQLADLTANPDEYLASMRLPRTVEERLRVEADLCSARQGWIDRLLGLR